MAWQQTPFTIPLVAATVSSLVIAVVAWRHRDYTGARALTALMLGGAWWSLFYAVGLASVDLAGKLVAYKLMYVGIGVVPVAWLVFAMEYTGREEALTRRRLWLLLVVPAVTVALVLTNQYHGLIWSSVDTVTRSDIVVMRITYGPWFWVHTAYSYLLLAGGTALVLRMVLLSQHIYRGQAVALAIAVLVPWGANVLYLSGVTGVWDPTNVGIVFSGAIIAVAIFRHQLLDVVPAAREVARDEIIDSMTEAVIVVDRRDHVVDLNPAAEPIIGQSASEAVGEPLDAVLPSAADVATPLDGDAPHGAELTRTVDGDERTYDVRISPLRRGFGTITGRLVTLRDVTERNERERRIERQRQLLAVINRVLRHDIRNDMNLLLALADELQSAHPDDPAVERIVQKGRDIVDLSERARRFEQVVGGGGVQRQVVDVAGVVERQVADLQQSYPDARLSIDRPDRAEAYAHQLIDSAVGNLLENAIKHNDRDEPRVEVRVVTRDAGDDGEVLVEIADDGPGLPEREQEVLQMGAETALEHSSGLGLWLAYWFVTESGGDIGFSENEPRGTVCTLRLEAAPSDAEDGE